MTMMYMFNLALDLLIPSFSKRKRDKPIFHCDAKTFALGPCVGLDSQLEISCLYLKTLIFALPPMPILKLA